MDAVEAVALAMLNGKRAREGWPPLAQIEPGFIDGDEWRLEAADALSAASPFIAAEWQPIETAPKDGSTVMLYDNRFEHSPSSYLMASWHAPLKVWAGRPNSKGRFALWYDATHWQPFPAPPTAIKETIR